MGRGVRQLVQVVKVQARLVGMGEGRSLISIKWAVKICPGGPGGMEERGDCWGWRLSGGKRGGEGEALSVLDGAIN